MISGPQLWSRRQITCIHKMIAHALPLWVGGKRWARIVYKTMSARILLYDLEKLLWNERVTWHTTRCPFGCSPSKQQWDNLLYFFSSRFISRKFFWKKHTTVPNKSALTHCILHFGMSYCKILWCFIYLQNNQIYSGMQRNETKHTHTHKTLSAKVR